MMKRPKVLVLRSAGVNCELETAHAWELAGASACIVHINELRSRPGMLEEFQILTIPGGFSYGDDITAGKIFANQLMVYLKDALWEFSRKDNLIVGICNGFQVLCKSGLLPGRSEGTVLPPVTIAGNLSAKYEDRWVRLEKSSDKCIFLNQQSSYELPVAHGEGRVTANALEDMMLLQEKGCLALRYRSADGEETCYPDNPNGSMLDVAGLCDPTGRIFGLMPHPERFVEHTHHPTWTSREIKTPHGRMIFESAVAYFV